MILELKADAALADQLFGDGDVEKTVKLNSEKEYKEFGKSTADILYKGKAPYRIAEFYKELSRDLNKHVDSKAIKKIADNLLSLYNETLRAEK